MLSAAVVCAYAPPTTLAAPSALATALQAELDALTAANPDFAITLGWKSSTEELALSSGVVKGSLFPDGRADRPADPHIGDLTPDRPTNRPSNDLFDPLTDRTISRPTGHPSPRRRSRT